MITQSIRKLTRLHYTCINSIVPFKRMRWMLTTSIVLTYIATTNDVCQDLNTYLVGFYLLMLMLSYFLPKGISHEIDTYDEQQENPFTFTGASLASNSTTQDMDQGIIQHQDDKPLLRQLSQIQLWQRSTLAIVLGLLYVFWPLLLVYFIGLAAYTILKILKTMRRYGYGFRDFQKQLK